MKSIELTKEHKSKLSEMCKILFPEYTFDFTWLNSRNQEVKFWNDEMKTARFIHWFEFCMTHLINSLAWKNIKTDILADCEYEDARLKYLLELSKDRPSLGQYHPINYLYEEFKKLK